jgi:nucleoside-diphosphate-sugar epimerase
MKKKLLFTGCNGFLGLSFINCLESHFFITSLGRSNANLQVDLSISFPIIDNFDIIIHAAGKAHSTPRNVNEIKDFFDINVIGTRNLLAGIENSGSFPHCFIFISTVAVYGIEEAENINEESPLLAKNPYGLSKIHAEKLVQEWCKKHNVVCTILRLPLVVGQNPPGNLGAMLKGIKKGYYFNIAGGKAKKSMVLAEDVAKAILKVSSIGGVYNLTDGYHPTFSEISNCMSSHLGKGKPLNMPLWLAKILAKFGDFLGDKAPINTTKLNKITSDLTFDDSKAREAFGWSPRKVVDWYADKH